MTPPDATPASHPGPDLASVSAFLARAPIASWLKMDVEPQGMDVIFRLVFDESHIGNPAIRAIHGGVVAAFLEVAMQATLAGAAVRTAARIAPSPGEASAGRISLSVDYLASTHPENMHASVEIDRLGRRIAFLSAIAWQGDRTHPVAIARGCFRLGQATE